MRINRRNLLKAAGLSPLGFIPIQAVEVLAQQGRTLVVASPGTPEGFDSDILRGFTQHAVTQVYENLTRYGKVKQEGRIVYDPSVIEGHLAESWKISDEGKKYLFTLRKNVRSFHGNELTAADVEWSWAKSIALKRTGLFIANAASVTSVKAITKYEVEFTLSAPNSLLLPLLTIYVPAIYDSTEVKKHATTEDPWALKWIESNTAGFGAYHLESLKAGEQATWVANPNYFGPKPYYSRVISRAVPSAANRATLLKGRQVHWIPQPPVQQVKDLQQDRNVKIESAAGRNLASIRMNNTIKPFDDVRVRRAFIHAIDRNAIRKAVFLDTGLIANSVVPPMVPGSDQSQFRYDYDPAKARKLLADAGYADGIRIELNYTDEWWWPEPTAILVAAQLKEVGVTAVPTKITAAESRARTSLAKRDLPFFCFEEGPIALDPVYALVVAAQSTGVSNRVNYKNATLDTMVEESKRTLDPAKRLALVREAQRLWAEDAPWIPLIYPNTFATMGVGVGGWVPDYIERWAELRAA
ncbi:ABC transporter substrate-binding protein [Ferrovibrio sp.]|uniref:ABC transporter substrate-binding protein n=1 Tax=Ferrovibrio sp. TaxID=1917215 RepID=UPI0035B0F724